MCGDPCYSAPTGSRERCNWYRSPPTREPDCHIQRGWPPEAMETVNCRLHCSMVDPESPMHGCKAIHLFLCNKYTWINRTPFQVDNSNPSVYSETVN